MAITSNSYLAAGKNNSGTEIRLAVNDTGLTDGFGNPLYATVESRSASQVAPTAQATTASFADVTGSTLDTLNNLTVSYTIQNTDNTNSLDWQVLAANDSAFTAPVTVQSSAAVIHNATSSYNANPAVYRYYKVQVRDTSGGSHATAVVNGITKG